MKNLFLLSFLMFGFSTIVLFILSIVSMITRRNGKFKKKIIISSLICIASFVAFGFTVDNSKESDTKSSSSTKSKASTKNKNNNEKYKNVTEVKNTTEVETKNKKRNLSKQNKETKNTTVKNQKIFDDKNVVIKATGFEECVFCDKVKIYIENNSNLNLSFYAHAYAVNGIMTDDSIYYMDCDVASGKKANTELDIKNSFMKENNIKDIKTIDILIWAYDDEKNMKEFDTGQLTINTNKNDGKRKSINCKKVLYENDGLSVGYMSNSGNKYTYLVTNNTGEYLEFDVNNISINDYTITNTDFNLISVITLNKCQSIFTINVDNDFLSDNDIKSVKNIEFNLGIRPQEDYLEKWSTRSIKTSIK